MKTLVLPLLALIVLVGCSECPQCSLCEECGTCPVCELSPGMSEGQAPPVTVTKYVCMDGRILDAPEGCMDTGEMDEATFEPNKGNEEGSLISTATIEPACIYGENGGSVYFKLDTISNLVEFQVKEDPAEEFRSVHNMTNAYEGRRTFSIVKPGRIWSHGDFELMEGRVYLFRLKFSLPAYNTVQYSNEHILDLRPDTEYQVKRC